VALEWGDAPFRPHTAEDLLAACREKRGVRVLWLCSDQANWGRLPALEALLTSQARLPFDLQTDGKAEFDPELLAFRPGGQPVRLITTARGEPVIAARRLARLIRELASALKADPTIPSQARRQRGERALAGIRALVHLPLSPLPPFEIV